MIVILMALYLSPSRNSLDRYRDASPREISLPSQGRDVPTTMAKAWAAKYQLMLPQDSTQV